MFKTIAHLLNLVARQGFHGLADGLDPSIQAVQVANFPCLNLGNDQSDELDQSLQFLTRVKVVKFILQGL